MNGAELFVMAKALVTATRGWSKARRPPQPSYVAESMRKERHASASAFKRGVVVRATQSVRPAYRRDRWARSARLRRWLADPARVVIATEDQTADDRQLPGLRARVDTRAIADVPGYLYGSRATLSARCVRALASGKSRRMVALGFASHARA